MSFGFGGSENNAAPLTSGQRGDLVTGGVKTIGENAQGLPWTNYQSPEYVDPSAPKTMSGGDYSALQASLLKGGEAGLDYSKGKDIEALNSDLAKRGVWSSGLADKAIQDREAIYAPQYAAAGATAANTAAGLQSQENQGVNTYNLNAATAKNAYAADQASQQYNAGWAPLNYLKDLYNQSGGTISSGSSRQLNMGI